MIYDTPIVVAQLPDDIGTVLHGAPRRLFSAFCGEKEVFHSRYWEAVQADSRIDLLVELPLHRPADAGMYAVCKKRLYSIEQAQYGKDSNGLPVTILSLKKVEVPYDISRI